MSASASYPQGGHALVFGASGLAAWGVMNQLLQGYPEPGTFTHVTGCVNRPLKLSNTQWPTSAPGVPLFDLVSGIDLTKGSLHEFADALKVKVKNLATAYGIYNPGGVFKAPLHESMVPPPLEFEGGKLHYDAFRELLAERSEGKRWTWCDIRPDAIIGFAPSGSAFNLVAHWATYLALYSIVEGNGARVPFPGVEAGYKALYNDVSSDMIGKLSIWASLHPDRTSSEIFNVADRALPSSMEERWPKIAAYFGLEGVAPLDDNTMLLMPTEYIKKHRDILDKRCANANEVFYGDILDRNLNAFTFNRHLILDKARNIGFLEETDPNASWFEAFEQYKAGGMLPE